MLNEIFNGVIAVVTVLLAALALWGDQIRAWLHGPRLRLVLSNPKGDVFQTGAGVKRIYYLTKVVNDRPSALVNNCQVRLKSMRRQDTRGTLVETPVPYPLPMPWAPSEYTPALMTVRHEAIADFGYFVAGAQFVLNPRVFPFGFDLEVRYGEKVQCGFDIVSDEFVSPALHWFEVSNDRQSVTVREVK